MKKQKNGEHQPLIAHEPQQGLKARLGALREQGSTKVSKQLNEIARDPIAVLSQLLHDEAYNSWCKGDRDDKWNKAEERAWKLVKRLEDSLELYTTFYRCDNETGDKEPDNFKWFQTFIQEKVATTK